MSKSVENLITQHLDTWTQAIETKSSAGRGSSNKSNLVGIQKLRELILEMAVRGLLVPQDPKDEPARKLLEKIAAEKAQLIKGKKIKKTKSLPEISEDEKPFDLPAGWEWVRLGNIAEIERGGSPRPIKDYITDDEDGLNWIKIGDTQKGSKYIEAAAEKIRKEGLVKTREVFPGDFLLTNSMSFGRPYISKINGCIHDGWLRIHPPEILDSDYLYLLLSSPFVFKFFKASAAGAVVQNLNADKVRELPTVIPSIPEQKRIVAKVDELMALCDQLEQQTLNSIEAHQTMVETLLGNLVAPPVIARSQTVAISEPTEQDCVASLAMTEQARFHQTWSLIAENFDVLFTTEKSIETLKQTILQLAVMGKLVPQNPNDEPAGKLLEKIATEKAQLIKDKKIKKSKPLPEITDEEKPFYLPNGWEWVHLNEIISMMDAGWSPACPSEASPNNETWGVLKTTAVQTLKFLPEENKALPSSKDPRPQFEVKSGDILVTRAGPWNRVGISCLVKETRPKLMTSDKLIRFHLVDVGMSEEYMVLALQAGATAKYLESCKSGMASSQVNISQDKLKAAPIPLPALEEQTRIVSKVNELMTLCDQLKTQLQNTQQTQTHLAQSIAQEVLA